MAPDSESQADRHPIGCGPFKFVRWERYRLTEMERFENYFETDADGNPLPYLDRIIGLPKREDHVRLTALRTDEVGLIDQLPRANTAAFIATQSNRFQTWSMPTLGTSYVGFNVVKGPFKDKRLRQAAAHAIDREAILQAVYYGQGEVARGYYASASPWHVTGATPWPEYDPDKARFLLRQARGMETEVILIAPNAPSHFQQTGELIQAMWTEVGFKVAYNAYDRTVYGKMTQSGDFHAVEAGGSYRFDPDGWYSRQVLSTSPITERLGFHNERADKLIVEARQTADKGRRLTLYAEVDSIINDDLPYLYLVRCMQGWVSLTPCENLMTVWSRRKAFAWQYVLVFIRVWWWARSAKGPVLGPYRLKGMITDLLQRTLRWQQDEAPVRRLAAPAMGWTARSTSPHARTGW